LHFEIGHGSLRLDTKLVGQRDRPENTAVAPDKHGGLACTVTTVNFRKYICRNWHAILSASKPR
jgi:hypothetical protein